MGFNVAVVGATGNVGRELLAILAERKFPADEVVALASSGSIGREVSFGEDDVLKVQALDTFDFRGIDIVLSSPGSKVSAAFAPRAAKAGAIVIDNTSQLPHGARRAAGRARGQSRRRSRNTRSAASSPIRTARRSRWSSR